MEARCRICGKIIEDFGILTARGAVPPKLCEVCRRQVKEYRPKITVRHELIRAFEAKLGPNLCSYRKYEGDCKNNIPSLGQAKIYSIGGKYFGPWGGVSHTGKHLIFSYVPLKPHTPALVRFMKKIDLNSQREWLYFVFEPSESENPNLYLELWFLEVYNYTFKDFGVESNKVYPIDVPHEPLLEGWGETPSGRFGNHWVLFLSERLPAKLNWED